MMCGGGDGQSSSRRAADVVAGAMRGARARERVESRAYVGDVACVEAFGRSTLVAGVGTSVHYFSLDAGTNALTRLGSIAAFDADGARVHGVRDVDGGRTCAVWGERRVRVMRREGDGNGNDGGGGGWRLRAETPLAPFAAWVHDVRGVDGASGEDMALAIGLSDNSVERWRRVDGGECWTRTARVECETRCLLYALALSASETWENLTVAAGTIFNEIQLWRVSEGGLRASCVGHEGSLMRVRFGDDGDEDSVYSASDDRTARVWTIPSGALDATTMEASPMAIRPSAVLAGHVARVWDCVRVDGERPVYASAGEDCSVRVWDADAAQGTETLAEGVARRATCELAALRGHRGRGIWRVCKLKSATGETLLASGGADGSVKVWNMSDWTSSSAGGEDSTALHESITECPDSKMHVDDDENDDETQTAEEDDVETDTKSKKRKKKSKRRKSFFGPNDEYVRVVRIARYGVMYAATNLGKFYRVTMAPRGGAWTWECACESPSPLMSMSVEETDAHDVVSLSDLEGVIRVAYVSRETGACERVVSFQASEPRVLMDVFSTAGRVYASIVGGSVKCWNLDNLERCVFTLTNPYKHRVLSIDHSDESNLVLIGDQKGNLIVFDADEDAAEELSVVAKKWAAHEKASINDCRILPGPTFVSGGRDSNACTWSLNDDGELILVSKWTAPSKAGAVFLSLDAAGELSHAAGFRELDFVAYSVNDQRQMMRIPCSAQNVPHDVLMGDGDRVMFVHRYKTSLRVSMRWSEYSSNADAVNLWSHGREIHTVRIVPPPPEAKTNGLFGVVSGAEDGTVMRLLYDASRAEGLRLYAPGDVCKHPGGRTVKALSVFKESERSYILCAGGAKEVLLAFRLAWVRDDAGAWDIKSTALVIPKPVDEAGARSWTKGCGYVEPRAESAQRIMDVAAYATPSGKMRVLYSTSRGSVSTVAMREDKRGWRKVSSLAYHTCPTLAVDVLETSSGTWACSGSTDGAVAVWRLDDSASISPTCLIERAHQSGVNALCISRSTTEGSFLIVSGGDDQKLRCQEIVIDADGAAPDRVAEFGFAHSSAVRSVWSDGARIITTSVDQRVKFWDIVSNDDEFALVQREGVVTQAPEPEAVDVLSSTDATDTLTFAVAGRGFEIFTAHR